MAVAAAADRTHQLATAGRLVLGADSQPAKRTRATYDVEKSRTWPFGVRHRCDGTTMTNTDPVT